MPHTHSFSFAFSAQNVSGITSTNAQKLYIANRTRSSEGPELSPSVPTEEAGFTL